MDIVTLGTLSLGGAIMLRPTITIEFTNASRVMGGEKVLLGGDVIGRTETAGVTARAMEVDVVLGRNDPLREETVFVVEAIGDTVVLVAIPQGKELVIAPGRRVSTIAGSRAGGSSHW